MRRKCQNPETPPCMQFQDLSSTSTACSGHRHSVQSLGVTKFKVLPSWFANLTEPWASVAGSALVRTSSIDQPLADFASGTRCYTAVVGFTRPCPRGVREEEPRIAGFALVLCCPRLLRAAGLAATATPQCATNRLAALAFQRISWIAARTLVELCPILSGSAGLARCTQACLASQVLAKRSHEPRARIALGAMVADLPLTLSNTNHAVRAMVSDLAGQGHALQVGIQLVARVALQALSTGSPVQSASACLALVTRTFLT